MGEGNLDALRQLKHAEGGQQHLDGEQDADGRERLRAPEGTGRLRKLRADEGKYGHKNTSANRSRGGKKPRRKIRRDDNVELKEQLQKLQDDFDAFKLDSESIKQQMQSNHETILQELRQNLADAESKSEKLQSEINQMHQKIHEKDEKMQDISNLNTIIMQDVNRKNLELKDYQNEMESSIRNAVNETNKMANANIKKIDRIKFLFGRQNINLNIPIDDIIADNTPARKQGFLEVITTPQITKGESDVEDNQETSDKKQD